MKNQKISIPFFIGYLLILIGTVLYIINNNYSVYVFCAGVIINLIFRFLLLPQQVDKRIRRLNNQQFFVAVLYILTGYAMWADKTYWVITLVISALIDLWLTYRYPKTDRE
jgi:membrane-associated HD superfamily phosphohydrolase